MRQPSVDDDVLAVGAGRDQDGVAGVRGRVDRRLDGGVAAVADQQDVGRAGAVDLLDAGERVGAFAPPASTMKWPAPSVVTAAAVIAAV